MTQEKQHDIALMRYSVISPIINGLPEECSSLDAFYRDAAKKGAVAPDGTVKHFSAAPLNAGTVITKTAALMPSSHKGVWTKENPENWMRIYRNRLNISS